MLTITKYLLVIHHSSLPSTNDENTIESNVRRNTINRSSTSYFSEDELQNNIMRDDQITESYFKDLYLQYKRSVPSI